MECKYCLRDCKNLISLAAHQRTCPQNKNRVYKNGMSGKSPWNKGLTKETDARVKSISETLSKTIIRLANNGTPIGFGRPDFWSDEKRKQMSDWRKALHLRDPSSHPNRKLAGNKTKWTYPERIAGDWFDANGIEYIRNKRILTFYPDFVIGNLIIEIDGKRWHNKEKDDLRDKQLMKEGYHVIRIQADERIHDRLSEIFNDQGMV